ncbi:unnamed protein product [Phyllotreta striolata]|uniref:RRM domain-containing protein n=1 Tax=Phyllotreta striolata TaxID=444603 RepID=A0A9N9U2N5_PHYSR|nr:unnamed protein product [Phyllotreta striolata]
MRRRTRKTQVPSDIPKKVTRSSTRRKQQQSPSLSEENADSSMNESQILETSIEEPEKVDSGNKALDNTEKSENKSELVQPSEDKTVKDQVNADEDEESPKGKSTGINDQTPNNIEHQNENNENVQGSAPSPKDKDENVQINEIQKDEQHDSAQAQEENVVKEENEPKEEEKAAEETKETSNETQSDDFESEYKKEDSSSVNGLSKTEESSAEDKPIAKKCIILKRTANERSQRVSSPLEDGEIQESKEKSRKITLKRHTIEESNSEIDKIVINRRPSTSEENGTRKKRLSSGVDENILTVVGKPSKPTKIIKLDRTFSSETPPQQPENARTRNQSWGKSELSDSLSSNTYKIDLESIKTVCPALEFLAETDIKLEEPPKESEIEEEPVAKKSEEEEAKSDEASEKEQSEEDESQEEQKIKTNANIIALNRKISIVDDTAAKLRPPPSPAKNPTSAILYITNLVRPFTIKQLRELLERTGKIKEDGFWTDRIKSKCYAHYECIEEAEATRNALHGIFWPVGNGKQLTIDYATEEEMEVAKNPVPPPVVVPEKLPDKENREPDLMTNKHREDQEGDFEQEERKNDSGREWDKHKEEHRRRHSRSRSRERARKHSHRSYTPEEHRKRQKMNDDSVPQKLMDDLFLKTKAMPSIYWQPLSPQEIATKQQQRLVRMEEHKRRIEETRTRRDKERRGSFRRR